MTSDKNEEIRIEDILEFADENGFINYRDENGVIQKIHHNDETLTLGHIQSSMQLHTEYVEYLNADLELLRELFNEYKRTGKEDTDKEPERNLAEKFEDWVENLIETEKSERANPKN